MGKNLYRALRLLLLACLCIFLAACGSREVSGLGSIGMNDESAGGIGTLGEPQTSDPTQASEPAESQQLPEPSAAPQSSALSTEKYENEFFKVTIPTGWNVEYDVVNPGSADSNLYLFVRDPNNSRNCFFFVQKLEPFFGSAEAKAAFLPYTDGSLDNAPVLDELSAGATMGAWTSVYATTQAQGFTVFEDFSLNRITEADISRITSSGGVSSYALGIGTISGASGEYYMFLYNLLEHTEALSGLPSNADFYTSYGNNAITLSCENETWFETLMDCLNSLDLSKYSASGAIAGSKATLPDVDVAKSR